MEERNKKKKRIEGRKKGWKKERKRKTESIK
jgi:hypothetical protein